MVGLCWIFGILALLTLFVLLLCLTWIGIHLHLNGETQVADVRIGLIRFRIYPGKRKAKKKRKKSSKQDGKAQKTRPKIRLADIKDAVKTLWPPLKKALERTRKGIRIDPLDLSVTLGGADDPADAAKLYAYLHAGMWTAMPLLERIVDIPDPHLHVGLNFREGKTVLEGEAALKARIGTLLSAAFGAGIPALKWFLRWKKQQKQAASQPTVSERKESNGQ